MINVLIPTDFSENSDNAIAYAVFFFKEKPCCFHLVHVIESDLQLTSNTVLSTAKLKLQATYKKIFGVSKSLTHLVHTRVIHGKLIEILKNEVEDKKIKLIVMATQGSSASIKRKIGSNTIDVISKIKCNVIIVPKKTTFTNVDNITLVSDYSIFFETKMLKTLSSVIEMFHSCIHFVHLMKSKQSVSQDQIQNKELLKDYFLEDNHHFYTLVNENPNAEIQKFVENKSVKLIVIVAKNVHLYQQLIFYSSNQNSNYQTQIPFLILHE